MKSIREAWIAASESATVINAHHISDGGDDIFAHVAEFVEDTGEGAVAALVDKSVEELRRRHVAIVLDSAISDLSLVRRGQNNRIARRVGLQLIGVTLGNLIGDVTLNDFLDSLIVPGKLPEATSRAINERPESYEAQLLACAIFVAAERWSAGIDFGWRAWREAKGKKGHRRSEAAYLVALCLRFSMQDPYHLRRAVELLESNLTLYNREREPGLQALLRRLRDTMELGNLLLSASVTQELASSPIGKTVLRGKRLGLFQGTSSQTQFEAGVRHLSAARLELLESEGGIAAGGSNSDALYAVQRWLKVMSATNLIGAFVFERTVLRLQSMRPSVVSCKEELDELEAEISRKERMDEPVRPTQVIYRHAARALMANHIDDRKQALGALKSALEMFLRDDKRLPLADRLEFLHLKGWLLLQEDLDFAN